MGLVCYSKSLVYWRFEQPVAYYLTLGTYCSNTLQCQICNSTGSHQVPKETCSNNSIPQPSIHCVLFLSLQLLTSLGFIAICQSTSGCIGICNLVKVLIITNNDERISLTHSNYLQVPQPTNLIIHSVMDLCSSVLILKKILQHFNISRLILRFKNQ